jgi:hypothetical protein
VRTARFLAVSIKGSSTRPLASFRQSGPGLENPGPPSVLTRREAAQLLGPCPAGSVRVVVAFHQPGSSGGCCEAVPGSSVPATAAPPSGTATLRAASAPVSACAPAVSSPQDPFLVLEPSDCMVLPWLLGVPPQGLPNNIIHPTLGRGIASGGRCFRRVMMSVGRMRQFDRGERIRLTHLPSLLRYAS